MNQTLESLCWFGKLPCIGDFCSHNMSAGLLERLDLWLSKAMQEGQKLHGESWIKAYFQTPAHGFVWGGQAIPELNGKAAIGIVMPSVDKAGRAFPFLLLQSLPNGFTENFAFESLEVWWQQAHALCASALDEDWCLAQLEASSKTLSSPTEPSMGSSLINVLSTQSHWFRIEYNGPITPVLQCERLPEGPDFDTLLGLGTMR